MLVQGIGVGDIAFVEAKVCFQSFIGDTVQTAQIKIFGRVTLSRNISHVMFPPFKVFYRCFPISLYCEA